MEKMEKITTFLKNNSLLEWRLSCSAIDWDSLNQAKGGSIFFGVGLCTSKEPAVAIPFDILAFFLEAEKLRKFFDLARVIVLIADTHALTNQFMTKNIVEKLSLQTITIFEHIIKNLNLASFEIRKASTMRLDSSLDTVFPTHTKLSNRYLAQEIADVIWMIRNDNLKLKLGWSIDSALEVSGNDERFFDLTMKEFLPRQISFLFTGAGRTFDIHRQKVSPYISVKGEHRLLLSPNEPIAKKIHKAEIVWSNKHFGGARKHLANIIREFENLFGHLAGLSFEQKLQHINDFAMKGML